MQGEITPTQGGTPASGTPQGKPLQAPVPQGQPSEGGAPSNRATPVPVVPLDQLTKTIETVLEKFTREQQGQRDRMEARFNKRIGDLQAAGITPTEEQKRVIAQQVANEDSQPVSQAPGRPAAAPVEQATTQPHPGQDDAPINPLDMIAQSLMADARMSIDEGDPEAGLVDWTNSYTTATSIAKAIEAKRARISNASTPIIGGLPAGSNPIANINDPYELLKGALK